MRAAFARTLAALAEHDPRIMLLTGDLGFMALEPFAERHPGRFLNAGVAEQNMVGVATGLAEAGFLPYVYSIVTFAALRPYEFIKNGPVLHRLPVRIVGVGGGFEYGTAGPSHHGLEDVGVMRLLPGLTVLAPADHRQAARIFEATSDVAGPIYYRIGKDDRTEVPGLDGRFQLGKAEFLAEGADAVILAMGSIAAEAAEAARVLRARGLGCGLAVVSTLSPAPTDDLRAILQCVPLAITVEAHSIAGGLGALASEVVAEAGLQCRIVRCGVRAAWNGKSGSQAWLHRVHGLDATGIVEAVTAARASLPR